MCVTCFAKNNPSGTSSPVSGVPLLLPSLSFLLSAPLPDCDDCHLKRKINPCTAALSTPSTGWIKFDNESSSRLHNSVNSTLRVPNDSMREVNTPGSDSIVHQSLLVEDAIVLLAKDWASSCSASTFSTFYYRPCLNLFA